MKLNARVMVTAPDDLADGMEGKIVALVLDKGKVLVELDSPIPDFPLVIDRLYWFYRHELEVLSEREI